MSLEELKEQNAQVIAVFPDKVKISVKDLDIFRNVDETLKVGSYLKIEDSENASLIAIIENFQISIRDVKDENGFSTVTDPPKGEPFYGIGVMGLRDRLKEVLDHYNKTAKRDKYNDLMENFDKIFCQSMPVK